MAEAPPTFPGAASDTCLVTGLPERGSWAYIRKMFRGSPKLKTGKVDARGPRA